MAEINKFVKNWWVNDVFSNKALIKYGIKQLESRLHKALGLGKKAGLKPQEAARYCSELSRCYEHFLSLIDKPTEEQIKECHQYSEKNPLSTYLKIQALKQQLLCTIQPGEEYQSINELKNSYSFLHSQISLLQPQPREVVQAPLGEKLKVLSQSTDLSSWLSAIVSFANESGEETIIPLNLCLQLKDKELLQLANLFAEEDFVLLINSIFFYKMQPQGLFKQAPHPEKLISVKARLTMLYYFIEMIHQSVMQTLQQRGIQDIHDYLFHGDELPQGIAIDSENRMSDLIITALKQWRLNRISYADDIDSRNKLYDLFFVYKFWFNPNRLIDILMTLQRRLTEDDFNKNAKKFSQAVFDFYHQLTTTECLELYGYFANKDSIYLMRTLAAAMQGQIIPLLPILSENEQEVVAKVYRTLDLAMEALREVLVSRHITTTPYCRISTKEIKPGRRNLNALTHILELYCSEQQRDRNMLIEQLFTELR